MKKRCLSVVLLLLLSMLVFATEDTPAFMIKAYKVGVADYLKIIITDALSNSLDVAGNNGEIDISNNLKSLMGHVGGENTEMTYFGEHVIFSYRVAGNVKGTYKLTISIHPFILSSVDSNPQPLHMIQAAYEIDNMTYVFSDNGESTIQNYSIANDVSASSLDRIVVPGTYSTTAQSLSTDPGTFVNQWTVGESPARGSLTTPEWIVRGAVAVDVGPTSYGNADPGTYRSKVIVKLETVG